MDKLTSVCGRQGIKDTKLAALIESVRISMDLCIPALYKIFYLGEKKSVKDSFRLE